MIGSLPAEFKQGATCTDAIEYRSYFQFPRVKSGNF